MPASSASVETVPLTAKNADRRERQRVAESEAGDAGHVRNVVPYPSPVPPYGLDPCDPSCTRRAEESGNHTHSASAPQPPPAVDDGLVSRTIPNRYCSGTEHTPMNDGIRR